MPRGEIPTFTPQLQLPGGETGAQATAQDFGAQIGESMQNLGGKIEQGSATVADTAEMFAHMQAQQWVSTAMTNHRNIVDKYMADPKNYSDPNFSGNVSDMLSKAQGDLVKAAPNMIAKNQLNVEMNDFKSQRMESAYKTQTDVMMQKGYNDLFFSSNTMLDSYRTNLKSPNIDAGAELFKQADDLFTKIDRTYGVIAPTMARELKEQVTSQLAYGAVNTNPDLAEKLLNRGYIEGRTRHFLEDSIETARSAQNISARQSALDFSDGLLRKAEMFPDQVLRGPGAEYYEAHGFKAKEAQEIAQRIQSKLDVNKDFGMLRDSITGMNEQGLLKKQDELYNSLKSLDPSSDKFNHDAEVMSRTQKFVQESIEMLHSDPVKYLSNYNKEISSATQAYRDNPSSDKFNNLVSLTMTYQGAAPDGDTSDKYLNLPMHEMHVMDSQYAQDRVKDIMASGPRQAGQKLHSIIQSYEPDAQALALNDLVDHGKLPITAYAMERTYGAPFSDKLNGALAMSKELNDTVGKQKGNTYEDFQKLLDTNNDWQQWSKLTAADNFQRQDIVAGFKDAVRSYSLGLTQDGTSPKDAVSKAVWDLTQWGHENVEVNGRHLQLSNNIYKGTPREFSMAVGAAIQGLDISRLNLANDNHSPIFPVALIAGHKETQQDAIRSILSTKLFPNMNRDGKSFSLYVRGQANDFQLRDTDGKPVTMDVKDLPTFTYGEKSRPTTSTMGMYGTYTESTSYEKFTSTNWPSMSLVNKQESTADKTVVDKNPFDVGNSLPPEER